MSNCKRALSVVGRLWALLAVVGLLAFGFLGLMPWVPLQDTFWGLLRGVVIFATFAIGAGCAFNYVNECK